MKLVVFVVTLQVCFGLVNFLEWRDQTEQVTRSEPCPHLRTLGSSGAGCNFVPLGIVVNCSSPGSFAVWYLLHVLNHSNPSKCHFRTGYLRRVASKITAHCANIAFRIFEDYYIPESEHPLYRGNLIFLKKKLEGKIIPSWERREWVARSLRCFLPTSSSFAHSW